MKVLFVCYANFGRSQVAQAYFATLSKHESDSAGIAVNERIATTKVPSRKLKDNLNQRSVEYVRREFGLDIAEKERQQLLPAMLDTSDLVIVMAEKEKWPDYLEEGGKVVFWNIQDAFGMADDFAAEDVYLQVQRRLRNWSPKSADRLRNLAHCFIPRRGWWKADRPPSCPYNRRRSLSSSSILKLPNKLI